MFIPRQPLSQFIVLGSGSNGNQSTLIAVKLLFNFGISTSKLQRRFENEYEILKQMPPHDNIVQVLIVFTDIPTIEMIFKMNLDLQLVQEENIKTQEKRIRQAMFVVLEYHPVNT